MIKSCLKSLKAAYIKINLSINEHGQHNEKYWSDEFPKSIEWLFFNDK